MWGKEHWRFRAEADIEMGKKGHNETNMFKSGGLGDADSTGFWGEITANDKKMVDEAWHRFWSIRGTSPPNDNFSRYSVKKYKEGDNSAIDTSELE